MRYKEEMNALGAWSVWVYDLRPKGDLMLKALNETDPNIHAGCGGHVRQTNAGFECQQCGATGTDIEINNGGNITLLAGSETSGSSAAGTAQKQETVEEVPPRPDAY